MCRGLRASVTNSLASLHPDIAAQWHPTKNDDLTPDQVVAGSHKKAWWICDKGPDHEWPAPPVDRIAGHGCPMCDGKSVSVTNSLATLYPTIAAQWHPTKNGDLTPDQVIASSGKKAWWICDKGPDHEWPATWTIGRQATAVRCATARGSRSLTRWRTSTPPSPPNGTRRRTMT